MILPDLYIHLFYWHFMLDYISFYGFSHDIFFIWYIHLFEYLPLFYFYPIYFDIYLDITVYSYILWTTLTFNTCLVISVNHTPNFQVENLCLLWWWIFPEAFLNFIASNSVDVSQDRTKHAEHTHIIITSAQEADNVITDLDRSLSTKQYRVIKTTGNIGIYCPSVFRVRSGPNQPYYTEYDWECLSTSSTEKVKEITPES